MNTKKYDINTLNPVEMTASARETLGSVHRIFCETGLYILHNTIPYTLYNNKNKEGLNFVSIFKMYQTMYYTIYFCTFVPFNLFVQFSTCILSFNNL